MRLTLSEDASSNREIAQQIQNQFPQYKVRLFGLGLEKTILVEQSAWVGIQISRYDNKIYIEEVLPSTISSFGATLAFLVGLGNIFSFFYQKKRKALAWEIKGFLEQTYQSFKSTLH